MPSEMVPDFTEIVVSTLVPGASGQDTSPVRGHFVVFLGKTQLSQCLIPPRCINGYWRIVEETYQIATNCGGSDLGWINILSRGSRNTRSRFMLQKPG